MGVGVWRQGRVRRVQRKKAPRRKEGELKPGLRGACGWETGHPWSEERQGGLKMGPVGGGLLWPFRNPRDL